MLTLARAALRRFKVLKCQSKRTGGTIAPPSFGYLFLLIRRRPRRERPRRPRPRRPRQR
jgi:hypothetical protein